MASNEQPTPLASHLPGGWIETPAESTRQQSYIGAQPRAPESLSTHHDGATTRPTFINNALHTSSESYYGGRGSGLFSASSHSTAVPSPDAVDNREPELKDTQPKEEPATYLNEKREEEVVPDLIRNDSSSDSEPEELIDGATEKPATRPSLQSRQSKPMTEDDLYSLMRESFAGIVRPFVDDRGLRWETAVVEGLFKSWMIDGMTPPPPFSDAEKTWARQNKPSPYDTESA